jgi:hypothetical protein
MARAHQSVELLDMIVLLGDEAVGVADNVDEQHVPDPEVQIRFDHTRHWDS